MLSFFPRGVLDEILNLIESVSAGFPSYSLNIAILIGMLSSHLMQSEIMMYGLVRKSVKLSPSLRQYLYFIWP